MTTANLTCTEKGYQIYGGTPLSGTIQALGAKNSVTKCLVATLLTDEVCYLENVPDIQEVEITIEMLESIGSIVRWNRQEHQIEIQTKEILTTSVANRFSAVNRIPILLLGALLGRTDKAVHIPSVGGCQIGARPVNYHLNALKCLGAQIETIQNGDTTIFVAKAPNGLVGSSIHLDYPSLGASENALLAASWASGCSTIYNISIEPEFIDLIHFVQKMGVIVTFLDERTIQVQKGKRRSAHHRLICDRAYTASFAMLAYATRGEIFIEGARQDHLGNFLSVLQQINAPFYVEDRGIRFKYENPLEGSCHIETGPYPCFLTDMQQPLVTLLTQCKGISTIHETVYEQRFGYTKTLVEMGAHIQILTTCQGLVPCRFHDKGFHHFAQVSGPTPLVGRDILIPDLRAGFAYVIASLIAEEKSTLKNIHYLKRGYGDLISPLRSLGAKIEPLL